MSEQMMACLDIVKRRTWEQAWPPGTSPIRYAVDRDLPGPVSSPYPATDREIRLLAAMCRYQEEHEGEGDEEILKYVREYLAEDRDIEKCIEDFTEYIGKLVTRMELAKQDRREQQLYSLWRELNEQ